MENEVLKMYEYAEQTIEISLVKEEEIPVMLELMNTIYQELPDKSWFSMGNWQQSLWRGRQNLGKKIMENI